MASQHVVTLIPVTLTSMLQAPSLTVQTVTRIPMKRQPALQNSRCLETGCNIHWWFYITTPVFHGCCLGTPCNQNQRWWELPIHSSKQGGASSADNSTLQCSRGKDFFCSQEERNPFLTQSRPRQNAGEHNNHQNGTAPRHPAYKFEPPKELLIAAKKATKEYYHQAHSKH